MSIHTSTATEEYSQSIERWRAQRVERLKAPDSWLALAGLFWLKEGSHTVGSDPSSDIVLPEKHAPLHAGTVTFSKGTVYFDAHKDAVVTHNNQPVTHTLLQYDTTPDPTVLRVGSVSLMAIERGEKKGIRIRDTESPQRTQFKGLTYFPIRSEWNIQGTLTRYTTPHKAMVPTAVGGTREESLYGRVDFTVEGKPFSLEVMQDGDRFFIAFADTTNGKETYNPGRFLTATADKDGRSVWLDFNKAYNPPCAFTPYATCSFPHKENRLPLAITAGEKKYHP